MEMQRGWVVHPEMHKYLSGRAHIWTQVFLLLACVVIHHALYKWLPAVIEAFSEN